MFSQVQSAINSVAATINLAHVLVDLGQPRGAAVLVKKGRREGKRERGDGVKLYHSVLGRLGQFITIFEHGNLEFDYCSNMNCCQNSVRGGCCCCC